MPARYSKPVTVEELDHRARAILLRNDRGTYTVPNGRVYPFQWNWDSAFASLGFAAFDLDRAWREIESLFEGQWEDGFLPHHLLEGRRGLFPRAGGLGNRPDTAHLRHHSAARRRQHGAHVVGTGLPGSLSAASGEALPETARVASVVWRGAGSDGPGSGPHRASLGIRQGQLPGVGCAVAGHRRLARGRVRAARYEPSRPERTADKARLRPLRGAGAIRARARLEPPAHRAGESVSRHRCRHDHDTAARESRSSRASRGSGP